MIYEYGFHSFSFLLLSLNNHDILLVAYVFEHYVALFEFIFFKKDSKDLLPVFVCLFFKWDLSTILIYALYGIWASWLLFVVIIVSCH